MLRIKVVNNLRKTEKIIKRRKRRRIKEGIRRKGGE